MDVAQGNNWQTRTRTDTEMFCPVRYVSSYVALWSVCCLGLDYLTLPTSSISTGDALSKLFKRSEGNNDDGDDDGGWW